MSNIKKKRIRDVSGFFFCTESSETILIKKEMDKEENVIFAGRLAQYKYYNMDLVVKNALEIFETQIKKNH